MIRRGFARPAAFERGESVYRRDTLTWVAFAALFAFGLLNAALGPVLPYLRQSEHLSYLVAALHQAAFAVGGTTAGILASRSSAPRRRTIGIGLTLAAAAGVVLGYGRVFPLTMAAALLVSAFATAALIRIWALLADLHQDHRAVAMTEGEVAVSLAGIVMPAVVSVCAGLWVSWRFSFVIAFVLVVTAAVAVVTRELPDAGAARSRPDSADPGPVRSESGRGQQRRSLTTVFAVSGLEFTLSLWAASYLHDDVGIARDTSVALVSALYAANLVGRIVASRLARRFSTVAVLRLSLVTALVGIPILLVAGNAIMATIGLAISGAGIGGTFPLASSLHVAASRRTADQALGQILTVAGLGQIIGPLAAGALGEAANLRVGLFVLPALVLLAAATTRRA